MAHATHKESGHKVKLTAEAKFVQRSERFFKLYICYFFVALPSGLALRKSEVEVIQIIMNRQVLVPLDRIQCNNVNNNLEGNNDQLKEDVVNKIVNQNSIVAGDLSLIIENPQQNNEIASIVK